MNKDIEEALRKEAEEIERQIRSCSELRTIHTDDGLKEKLYRQIAALEEGSR